jgi:glycosyltransferase involved in cell wall biosynthesis
MRFSVVMASYLKPYQGGASKRDEKFIRAIKSILNQTFKDFEIIVVADGCDLTYELVEKHFKYNVSCYLITKQPFWSGVPRTLGGMMAKGDFILYLDSDDKWGKDHLKIINDNLKDYDWVWFNDYRYNRQKKKFIENRCYINRIGFSGTSNICFKRSLGVTWNYTGYAHDYYFNRELLRASKNSTKIETPEYYVCHLPTHPGGIGYDI